MLGGKKVYKTVKTKYKKEEDGNLQLKNKKKRQDKSTYRLLKQQQREDYVL